MVREYTLREVARMMGGRPARAALDLVRGVSIDSRTTRPGEVFFALRGEHADGHDHVPDALRRGALAAVVARSQYPEREILVRDPLFTLGEFARRYRLRHKARTIAITGTNGKTTVKNLIAGILSMTARVLATPRNYNSLIGLPLAILGLRGDEAYLVAEMGTNAPGEIKRLCDIARPEIGVITNFGPGHLEGLRSLDGVRKEKLSLFESLPANGLALSPEGVAGLAPMKIEHFSPNMLDNVVLTERGSSFRFGGSDYCTNLLGAGNVQNCLAAIRLTSMLGVGHDVQRAALAASRAEPGRMESIYLDRLLIINDTYNANPVSMKAAIKFAGQLKRRKVFVLGDMLELGSRSRSLHEEVGAYAKQNADVVLTLGIQAQHYGGRHFTDENGLLACLKETLMGDEVVLFKASRALRFERHIARLTRLLR